MQAMTTITELYIKDVMKGMDDICAVTMKGCASIDQLPEEPPEFTTADAGNSYLGGVTLASNLTHAMMMKWEKRPHVARLFHRPAVLATATWTHHMWSIADASTICNASERDLRIICCPSDTDWLALKQSLVAEDAANIEDEGAQATEDASDVITDNLPESVIRLSHVPLHPAVMVTMKSAVSKWSGVELGVGVDDRQDPSNVCSHSYLHKICVAVCAICMRPVLQYYVGPHLGFM